MSEKNIQLFLVMGFLGSGKTTFLQNALTKYPGARTGIIVNEFGSIGIDGKILKNQDIKMVEINNGSIFCACLKGGFIKTLAAFLSQPVDYLFVEASGLADPSDMGKTLAGVEEAMVRKPDVTRRYDYRGSICVVDSVNFLAYAEVFPVMESQILKSNFILLNKNDDAEEEDRRELRDYIKNINPEAFLYPTDYSEVPLDILNSQLSIKTYQKETINTPWNRPRTYVIQMPIVESAEVVKDFAVRISPYTLRMKGFFEMKNGQGFLDAVDRRLQIRTYPRDYLDEPVFKLVLIGRDPKPFRKKIEKAWSETIRQELVIEED